MSLPNSSEIIKRAVSNFNDIKESLEFVSVDTSEMDSDNYGNAIRNIGTQIENLNVEINNLNSDKEDLQTQVSNLNDQVIELTEIKELNDTYFDDIYLALVEKGSEVVKENKNTYADEIKNLKINSGLSVIDKLDYFFYDNIRKPDDFWYLVTNKIKSMNYMLYNARLEAGNYILDLSGCDSCDRLFYRCYPNGEVNIQIRLGLKNTSLKNLFLDNERGDSEHYFNITFTEDSNVNNLENIYDVFSTTTFGSIDFTMLSGANLKTMHSMLCRSNIKNITGLQNLNVSNVTDFQEAFRQINQNEEALELDLSNWIFKQDDLNIQFNNMFYLANIKSIIFPDFNFGYTNHIDMFNASKLQNVKITIMENINDEQYKNSIGVFYMCRELIEVSSDHNFILRGCAREMFKDCVNLLNIPDIKVVNIHNNASSYYGFVRMFGNCNLISKVNINIDSNDNTQGYKIDCTEMFQNCTSLIGIYGNLNFAYLRNLYNMFDKCTSLVNIDASGALSESIRFDDSPNFNIKNFINQLDATNESLIRILLHSDISVDDETISIATSKNYKLVKGDIELN